MTDWQETRTAGATRGGNIYSVANEARARTPVARLDGHDQPDEQPTADDGPVRSAAPFAAGAAAARKLTDILELLKDFPGTREIHRDALRALDELQHVCRQSEQYLMDAVDLLLRHQARRYANDSAARTEVELLRRHFRPPLAHADTATRKRLEALLTEQDTSAISPAGTERESAVKSARFSPSAFPLEPLGRDSQADAGAPNPRAWDRDSTPDSDNLRQALGQEIRETLAQNEEFGVTLDLVLSELRKARSMDDAQAVRARLLEQVKRLHGGHFALAQKLDSADRYLRMLSLDSRHLNEELHRVRELSLTDELTSLPNRRAFMARVEEEVARVERYGMPMSLAVIDLDRFKSINDQLGHAAGDEVLRCYATQIFSVFRNHDLVARYGGEEFAVLLPNTDHKGAAAALRKVRECAARIRSRATDTAFPVPTFSAGVATLKRGESAQTLIDRADEALYRAKRGGRDRVEFALDNIS